MELEPANAIRQRVLELFRWQYTSIRFGGSVRVRDPALAPCTGAIRNLVSTPRLSKNNRSDRESRTRTCAVPLEQTGGQLAAVH